MAARRFFSSGLAADYCVYRRVVDGGCADDKDADRLWALSAELTGLDALS